MINYRSAGIRPSKNNAKWKKRRTGWTPNIKSFLSCSDSTFGNRKLRKTRTIGVLEGTGSGWQGKSVFFSYARQTQRVHQMAEGLLQAKHGNTFEVFSAGTRQSRVSPRAILVMGEIGIDISHHRSKALDEINELTV